ncbi:MAG: hypothetical protein H6741_06565 [Alphaproteobacteria bacterium]|nr:hypothetical protein [Alphaproteobacteria bacterium]MCB9792374.1 hypothetical protein [Alphaproteobacteria bacterium]
MRRELLVLIAVSAGCERGPTEEELQIGASRQVTVDTLASIGPHQSVSTIRRRYADSEDVTLESFELAWGDWDHYQARRLKDGRLRSELRVIDGEAWMGTSAGRFSHRGDAESFRVELRTTWSAWEQALAPFAGRVVLSDPQETVVEGRPAHRYQVSLAEAAEGGKKGTEPLSLSGQVTLDDASAIRLLAEVEGRYRELGRVSRERVVQLEITRSRFGEPPDIATPEAPRKRR